MGSVLYAAEVNPEAVISATIAANAAEAAANHAFVASIIIILVLLAVGAMIMGVMYRLFQLLKNQEAFLNDLREKRIIDSAREEKERRVRSRK